jgi:hypothetical protein
LFISQFKATRVISAFPSADKEAKLNTKAEDKNKRLNSVALRWIYSLNRITVAVVYNVYHVFSDAVVVHSYNGKSTP